MNLVMIKCFDMSHSSRVWSREEITDAFGLIDLEIGGLLVEEKEDCIIIAEEHQPKDSMFRHIHAIPKVCIREIINYRRNKRREVS